MKKQTLVTLISSILLFSCAAQSETVIKWLHKDADPNVRAFLTKTATDFEATHPDVKIEMQYLDHESYKKKLPTLLQSNDKPDIIYSWGGGVLKEQVRAGVIQDISQYMDNEWAEQLYPSGVNAFKVDGKQYGVPYVVGAVGFFYNKDIFEKVGIQSENIKTWDDLLSVIDKLKEAKITPLVVGGGEKWPLHFYWTYLALRLSGEAGFEAALKGENGGFDNPQFIQAAKLFQELAQKEPFQKGFIGSTFAQSSGVMGDGKAAMVLQIDDFVGVMQNNSADKVGIPLESIGWFPFPAVEGGTGSAEDILGGVSGWMLTQTAPKEAADFLKFFTEAQNQKIPAEQGLYLPMTQGTDEFIQHPIKRELMQKVKTANYLQIFYDQLLGPSAGSVINDMSVNLALGKVTPEEAAKAVENAVKTSGIRN